MLANVIADPDVGLVSTVGYPLGWYDPTYGQIGDACTGANRLFDGYFVGAYGSDRANACVVPCSP